MQLDEYQRAASRTLNPALTDSGRLLDGAAGLVEEAGEVLAHVRKHTFQQRSLDREGLAVELGDALWCLAAVASSLGLSLGDIAGANLRKLAQRWPEGLPGGAGAPRGEDGMEGP